MRFAWIMHRLLMLASAILLVTSPSLARKPRPAALPRVELNTTLGVIVIALAGTLTRFGGAESLYAGQMVGLIVLGVGMEWSNRVGYASRNSSTVAV